VRPALRHLFLFCAALSLLLCATVVIFRIGGWTWAPSPVWRETRVLTETRYGFTLQEGMVYLHVLGPPSYTGQQAHQAVGLGFGYARGAAHVKPKNGPIVYLGDCRSVLIPFWFTFAVTAALPVGWLARVARRKFAFPPGHCRRCGYDLRASPERCPECGTVAPVGR
jgi:hypothetical protein